MNANGAVDPDERMPEQPEEAPPAYGTPPSRPTRTVTHRRRPGALLGGLTVFMAAVLVGATVYMTTAGRGSTPSPGVGMASPSPRASFSAGTTAGPGAGRPTTSPAGTPASSPAGTPAPSPQGWAAVTLPAIEPVADLAATRTGPAGTSIDTTFVLTSGSGADPAELAKGIELSPPAALQIRPGTTAGTVLLAPRAPLVPGTTYRATLRLPDASLGGSWVFQTSAPPQVAGTLPADEATGVPVNTGIEVTFDQDGVGDIAPFFATSPRVSGHFEQHGRTAVFVPDALQPLTVYTVTVRRGVPLEGSDLVLERTLTFRFETAARPGHKPKAEPDLSAARDLVEVGTAATPVLELAADRGVSRVSFRVYRFPSLDAAVDAYVAFRAAPGWAERSDAGLVRTGGLAEVARFSTAFHRFQVGWGPGWVRFPARLAPGWYVAVIPRTGRDIQVFLQVTDVATTTMVASGQVLVWANDLVTGGPLNGATVATLDGTSIGRTGADGVMLEPIPARLLAADLAAGPRAGVLLVRAPGATAGSRVVPGRATFVPVSSWGAAPPYEDQLWRLLFTDRSLFRQTDTIEAWGLIRPRAAGATPAAELRLLAGCCWDDESENIPVAVARTAVAPDPQTGVFASSIPIQQLPIGQYDLGLWVGDRRIAGTSIDIGVIRKPAYQLDVVTDRRVVVDGDVLAATVTGSFFDRTRAPGIEVAVAVGTDEDSLAGTSTTTGADGTADVALPIRWVGDWSQWSWSAVTARPTGPEEAEIQGSTEVLVFRSRVVLDGQATLSGRRITVSGSLHDVDLARLEREQRDGYQGELRPQGNPVAGSAVAATVVESWDVCTRTGRVYDFIAKKAIDTFDCQSRQRTLGTWRAVTNAHGDFSFSRTVPAAGHSYSITLTAGDADQRETSLELEAAQAEPTSEHPAPTGIPTITLDSDTAGNSGAVTGYAVGDEIRATVRAGAAPMPTGGRNRYLFFVARPGFLAVRVQGSPTYVRRFTEDDIPGVSIGAVWFGGTTGAMTRVDWGCGSWLPTVQAEIDTSTRQIAVTLAADGATYRPGGRVTLAVRTTDAAGLPVAASVVLRAVDEKLYAIGGAMEGDTIGQLFWCEPGADGIVTSATSHPVPVYRPESGETCGCGAFCGPEDYRDDFRDTLLFQRVTTGPDGRATVSFDLSDDLTSWRISATAISSRLFVGQTTLLVPVGLPLFVEAPLAPDYLVGERPILRARAYGDALKAGDQVTFTVSAPSLGVSETSVVGTAFTVVQIPLPALVAGDHEIRVSATAGSGATATSDRLSRTIHVVDTRFTQRRTAYGDLADGVPQAGGTGLVTVVFADAGRGRFIEPLEALAAGYGARVDQALAAVMARDLLVAEFGADPGRFDQAAFDPSLYQGEPTEDSEEAGLGIRLLPYASADLALSARVALVAPGRFDVDQLRAYLDERRSDTKATRESRNLALAGLAGLGEPILTEIRAALADPKLTIRERLYLALGAAALGDHATALAVERGLLDTYGQRLGPWLRLRVGSSLDDTIEATALVALIGATVGDPVAEWAEAYVEENRAVDELFDLQQLGYIERVLDRTPSEASRVAYTRGRIGADGRHRGRQLPVADAHRCPGGDLLRAAADGPRRGGRLVGLPGRSRDARTGRVAHDRAHDLALGDRPG